MDEGNLILNSFDDLYFQRIGASPWCRGKSQKWFDTIMVETNEDKIAILDIVSRLRSCVAFQDTLF